VICITLDTIHLLPNDLMVRTKISWMGGRTYTLV